MRNLTIPLMLLLAPVGCHSGPGATTPDSGTGEDRLRALEARETRRPVPGPRRSVREPLPGLPALPPDLDSRPPVILELVVKTETERGIVESRREVHRDREHLEIRFPDSGQVWHFLRNPRDPRRTWARLVDPSKRMILEYQEVDLIDAGIARGWRDVFTLGVSPDSFRPLRPGGRKEERGGLTFTQWVPVDPSTTEVRELWWNEEHLLPLRIVRQTGHGTWTQEIRELRQVAGPLLLVDPVRSHADYELMDMVDWREEHHGESSSVEHPTLGAIDRRGPRGAGSHSGHHHGHGHGH